MSADKNKHYADFEEVTGDSNATTGIRMLNALSYFASQDAPVPPAARFAQALGVLDEQVAAEAGSNSRYKWMENMKKVEKKNLGPVQKWLANFSGADPHPLLNQSIEWIELDGDPNCVPLQMFLADLLMEVGRGEEAKEVYSSALKQHRESGSTAFLIE